MLMRARALESANGDCTPDEQSGPMELRQWIICSTLLLCLQPMAASARHTDASPSIDSTAHVLAHREWRIGPFTTEVGLFDSLQLNVVHAAYLAGVRNIGLKVELPTESRGFRAQRRRICFEHKRLL